MYPLFYILTFLLFTLSLASHPGNQKTILLFRRIETKDGGIHLELTNEGKRHLESIRGPFGIVSAVGPTRTGKSVLLNLVMRGLINGTTTTEKVGGDVFEIGTGLQSHTHGIHMTLHPINVGTSHLPTYFIDTEGFYGVKSTVPLSYEANSFAFTHSISSVSIYNTRFPIDSADVNKLKEFAAYTKLFRVEVGRGRDRIRTTEVSPPTLVWTVQGFNWYNLQNDGIGSPDEFLWMNLGDTDTAIDVRYLRQSFRSMHMKPLVRPVDDDRVLAKLSTSNWDTFSAGYKKDMGDLVQTIVQNVRPVEIDGKIVDGGTLAMYLVDWVQHGTMTLERQSSWTNLLRARVESARKVEEEGFRTRMGGVEFREGKTTLGWVREYVMRERTGLLDEFESFLKEFGIDPNTSPTYAQLEKTISTVCREKEESYLTWASQTLDHETTAIITRLQNEAKGSELSNVEMGCWDLLSGGFWAKYLKEYEDVLGFYFGDDQAVLNKVRVKSDSRMRQAVTGVRERFGKRCKIQVARTLQYTVGAGFVVFAYWFRGGVYDTAITIWSTFVEMFFATTSAMGTGMRIAGGTLLRIVKRYGPRILAASASVFTAWYILYVVIGRNAHVLAAILLISVWVVGKVGWRSQAKPVFIVVQRPWWRQFWQ